MNAFIDALTKDWSSLKATVMESDSFKGFGITKFKCMNGRDGVAFSCVITHKRKSVGTAGNDGDGGPDYVRFAGGAAQAEWNKMLMLAKGLPEPHALVLDALLTSQGF